MAFLGRLFKGSGTQGPMRSVAQQADVSAKATEATISTIQQLADNEDRLTRRRELLEKKIAAELERGASRAGSQHPGGMSMGMACPGHHGTSML